MSGTPYARLPTPIVRLMLIVLGVQACQAAPAVEVPFELSGNHVFVEVVVKEKRLSFVFDTGAAGTGINADVAQRIGVEPTGNGTVVGALGTTEIPVADGLSISLGTLRINSVTAALVPLAHLEEMVGRNIDGIFGGDALRGRVVMIDYDRQILSFHDRKDFAFEGWGTPCPLSGAAGHSRVKGEIELLDGTVIDGEFAVDSGAHQYLELSAPFIREHRLDDRVGATHSIPARALTGVSIDKQIGHVRRFRFCGFELPRDGDLPIGLNDAMGGTLAGGSAEGLLGNGILKRFNIVFDHNRDRMFVRPNQHFAEDAESDASGLFLVRPPRGQLTVAALVSSSPATEAEVRRGDLILTIDGQDTAKMRLDTIRGLFRQVGASRELMLLRDGSSVTVELTLRPLADN